MKKVMKKFNRALSIMLVAAMVLTMAPQTAMPVLAAETGTEVDIDAPQVVDEEPVVEETGNPAISGQNGESGDDSITPDIGGENDSEESDLPEGENDPEESDVPVEGDAPVEGDVPVEGEEPAEGEKLPVVDAENISTMGAEIQPFALSDKKLYPSIDNSQKAKWTLTAVDGLTDDTKTYLTVKTQGTGDSAWDSFAGADGTDYSTTGIAADVLTNKILAFGVDVKAGWQLKDSSPVQASLMNGETKVKDVSATKVGDHYEIDLGALSIAEDTFGTETSLELKVWADVETAKYTVTVNKAASGIKTAIYTTDGTAPAAGGTVLGDKIENVAHNTALKLYVEGETGYRVTVKKNGTTVPGTEKVYDLGKITEATTVAIEVEQTHYAVTSTIERATDETESTITGDALKAVAIEWGPKVTGDDETGRQILKNTDLTFAVTGLGKLKADVSYTIKGGSEVSLTPVKGTYKVPKNNITDAVAIKVKVRSAKQVGVSMVENTDVKALTYKNAEGAFVAVDTNTKATEGETFEFKVEANTFFKVTEVTASDSTGDIPVTEKTEGTGDDAVTVYSLVAGTEAITITVTTALDEKQCYRLDMVVDGDEGSVTAAVTVADDETEADTPALSATLPTEKALITRNAKVKVVLTVDSAYELAATEPVKLGTVAQTETAAGNKTYELELIKGEIATLTVKTERKGLAADNTVTFNKTTASHMELSVATKTGEVEAVTGQEGQYTLKAGVKDLNFTLTADGAYVPTVKYSTNKVVKAKSAVKGEDGKTTYTYSLAAALLASNDTIVITEAESKKTLTVKYDSASVDVTIKSGNVNATTGSVTGGVSVEVTEGDILTVIAQAKDNCEIDWIKEKIGTAEEQDIKASDSRNHVYFYKYDVTVNDDVTVTIKEAKNIKVLPLKDTVSDTNLALNKSKKYDVRYDGSYEAAVMEGTANMVLADYKVKTKVGGKDVEVPETGENDVVNYAPTFEAGVSNKLQITLGTGLAGKDCTLELYKDAAEDAQPVATYALYVSAVPNDINANDVKINKGKAITQAADTTYLYDVAVNKGADVSDLSFEVPAADVSKDIVKSAVLEQGKLKITTGFSVGTVNLDVYTGTGANKKKLLNGETPVTVAVTTVALLDATDKKFTPNVKQVSSTDVSLTLSLDAKAAKLPAKETIGGKVYYEVELTPDKESLADTDKAKLKDKVLEYVEKTGDTQDALFYVGASGTKDNPEYGKGVECKFTVNVRLVHVADATVIPGDGTKVLDTNVKSAGALFTKEKDKNFVTKNPTFETNLKLKGKTTTVYTTQEDVVVAIPTFSKTTSYPDLKADSAEDITSGLGGREKLTVTIENNQIVASAGESTKLGKHTIQVLATTTDDDSMYASRATIAVTVVRGIEDISLSVPTDSIYYADKAVKVKTAVAYNTGRGNSKDDAPKAKKVTYKLVSTDTEDNLTSLEDLNGVTEAAVVANGVSIDKNGQISVPKNYKVTADSKFKVLVRAADFADNTAYDLSGEITITRDYMQIARAVIVKQGETGNYELVAADSTDAKEVTDVTASDLNGAMVVALAPGAPAKNSYTTADFSKYKITGNVSYTSGNTKAVTVESSGAISVKGPANKLKLTVAPTDGSTADKKLNSTKTITLNVTYDPVTKLGLDVIKENIGGTPEKYYENIEGGNIDYSDSSSPVFTLHLMSKDGENHWVDAPAYTDYKLTVTKGGKILPKIDGDGPNCVRIAANDKQTLIKLTYKVYNAATKKFDSINAEYTLTNTGLTKAVTDKVKAPKITFRNKRSTIQSHYTTTDKTLDSWYNETEDRMEYSERYIGFNLQPNGKDYPLDFNAGKVLDAEGKPVAGSAGDLYVKVDVDWSAMTAKNADDLTSLSESMWPGNYQKLNSNGYYGGYVQLNFNNDTVFTPGSYKLKVSVGTVDDNRNFVSVAQPAAITIKVAKDKKLSFKPTAAYKISATDNGCAVLTGKGDYDDVVFENLQNDNVKGKEKGKENAFTTYFELDEATNTLKMTDACFENGALKTITPDDLTGYVTYTASHQYTDTKDVVTGTVKIKVTLEGMKAIAKYAITNATADKSANAVANVTVTADKKPVTIAYALVTAVDNEIGGAWKVVTGSAPSWTESITPNGSVLTLQHPTAADKGAKAKVTLRVIPDSSYYKAKILAVDSDSTKTDVQKREAKENIIKTYGVELKTTITLNDLTDAKANKRIEVSKANLKQTFTAAYRKLSNGAESGFYTTDRNYWIEVPYTELYVGARSQITAIVTDKVDQVGEDTQEWIYVNKNTEEEAKGVTKLSISLNKDAMQSHFDDCYQKKTVKGQTVYQPKTINVKATVYYGGTAENPAAPSDEIKFTLTMPSEPRFMNEYNDDETLKSSDFDQAVSYIKTNAERISKLIADNMQKYNYAYLQYQANIGEDIAEEIKTYVTGELESYIRAYVGNDSGIDLDDLSDLTKGHMEVATGDGFKVPTTTETGLVKVTVKLTNGNNLTDGKKEEPVDFTVTLPAFAAQASDVETAVETFLDNAKVTNDTTKESLLADLRAYMAKQVYDTTSIRYEIETFEMQKATEAADGSLEVEITIYNIADGEDTATASRTLTIQQLLSKDALITAVKKAVGAEAPDTGTAADTIKTLTASNNYNKVKKAVLDAAQAAIVGNPYTVAYEPKAGGAATAADDPAQETDEFNFEPATGSTTGTLTFKLRIKTADGKNLNESDAMEGLVTVDETVAAITGLLLPTEAKTKVEAWITANTLTENEDASADSAVTKVLKNGVSAAGILDAIKDDATNGVPAPETSRIEMSFKTDTFKITDATVNEEGSITGTIVLKDTMENQADAEVTLNVKIPKLPQTEEQAAAKIKEAVEGIGAAKFGITAATEAGDTTVTEAITDAAAETKGLKKDTFDITVKTALAITPASGENPAKATITLLVKLKTGGTGDGADCAIEIAIPAETPTTP